MEKDNRQYQKMTETPIPKLITSLAVPTMLTMLVTSVYNVIDTYFVSKLGTRASAAVGIVFSLMALIQALGFTAGMGAGSVISRLLGKKDETKAQKIASCAFVSSAALGILLGAAGILFLEKLMRFLGAAENVLPYAAEYARYILYAAPVMMVSFVLNNLLRAEGKTKLSLIGIGCGSLLNIALDPLFIFAFDWGIRGAAIATAVSQCAGCAILFLFFLRKNTIIRISIKNFSLDFSLYKEFIGNGMPSMFRQGLSAAASITLNHTAAYYGDAAVAAMSIVGKIFLMVYCVLIGFGQGYQPVVGYNYGAGNYDRIRKSYRFFMIAGTVGMTLAGAALFFFSDDLIRQFVPNDKKVTETGVQALLMQCAAMPLLPIGIACNMTFQAVGKSVKAALLASCRQGIFFLPLIFSLPHLFGVSGLQAAQPAADALTFLVCVPVMHTFMASLKRLNKTDKSASTP